MPSLLTLFWITRKHNKVGFDGKLHFTHDTREEEQILKQLMVFQDDRKNFLAVRVERALAGGILSFHHPPPYRRIPSCATGDYSGVGGGGEGQECCGLDDVKQPGGGCTPNISPGGENALAAQRVCWHVCRRMPRKGNCAWQQKTVVFWLLVGRHQGVAVTSRYIHW